MKKSFLTFMLLLGVFVGLWAFQTKHPKMNVSYAKTNGETGVWWMPGRKGPSSRELVDDNWKLDPEIPINYIPVPGEEELYMVVNDQGEVEGYRRRTQAEDGSWVWEDVNPDIPSEYIPVPGLKDVYKVVMDNGEIKYYRYVRNKDNTFAFVEVDENGNELELKNDDTSGKVPENYEKVNGNIYQVKNEDGVVVGFKELMKRKDGSYRWLTVDGPEYSQVGQGVEDKGVLTPKHNPGKEGSNRPPYLIQLPGNNNGSNTGGQGVETYVDNQMSNPRAPQINRKEGKDGAYVEEETISETKTEGGWKVTYETKIKRTYNSLGVLQETKKEGPFEVSRVQDVKMTDMAAGVDASRIESSLGAEVSRVQSKASIKSAIAQDVLSKLNKERNMQGLAPLSMSEGSDAYNLALIYAVDMAVNNHADFTSPLYGSIDDIASRYGIKGIAGQNIWKSSPKSADDIHTRFQTLDGSRAQRMSPNISSYGVVVAELNGYYYICEVFLN